MEEEVRDINCATKLRTNWRKYYFRLIMLILLPLWLWLSLVVIFGKQGLPGESLFVLILLVTVGRIFGYALSTISLPPMLGMLGLGLIIRNVPYVDHIGKNLSPSWSPPIRQIALAVILTRAGLGLDAEVLKRLKGLVTRFAILPTSLEALTVAIIAHFVLDFSWLWGWLLGFVLAPVSPAVVVPRLLELRDQGYGTQKGIPTFLIAAACLDNVYAISLFGVILNLVFPASDNLALTIAQGPIQILIGIGYGIIWGFILGYIFTPNQKDDSTITLIRFGLTFAGGVVAILGFSRLGYSGAGALGCIISSFTASYIWRKRQIFHKLDPLCWGFFILWFIFEPLLFGIIGTQIDISNLELRIVYLGIGIICAGLGVRLVVSLLMVTQAQFTFKEKLFSAISWIPKATVQAAIGPMALDKVMAMSDGQLSKVEATNVLTLAVLSILLTSAVGELGVILTGPRFLQKQIQNIDDDH